MWWGWGSSNGGSLGIGNQTELHTLGLVLDPTGYTFPVETVADNYATIPFDVSLVPATTEPTATPTTTVDATRELVAPEPTLVEEVVTVVETVVEVVQTVVTTMKGNNGWGNGDQAAPGKSAVHNNAENNTKGKLNPLLKVTSKK